MRKVLYPLVGIAVFAAPQLSQAAQIAYRTAVTSLNPRVYLQMDETSGTTATDSGVNAINGTYSSDATFSLGNPSASGLLNTAIRENGLNTLPTPVLVNVGTGANSPSSVGTGAFSVEVWFNNNAFDDRQDIMDMNGGTGSDFGIFVIGNGTTPGTIRVAHTGTDIVTAAAGPVVSINAWHYLVFTRDATGVTKLYLDDVLTNTGSDVTTMTSTAPVLAIGGKTVSNTRTFDGSIDEFAFYGTALTQADVDAHFLLVPEPASLGLLSVGAMALLARRRRRGA